MAQPTRGFSAGTAPELVHDPRWTVDELSLVLMPTADAQPETHTLVEADRRYAGPAPVKFKFISAELLEGGSIWLRYTW